MKPERSQLSSYESDFKKVAIDFNVSERTARRWLNDYGLYHPKRNFGAYKLSLEDAREIRIKHINNGVSSKDLAKEYEVTFASIRRILNNETYPENKTAGISVTYNPKET